jgi:hypothetical protein
VTYLGQPLVDVDHQTIRRGSHIAEDQKLRQLPRPRVELTECWSKPPFLCLDSSARVVSDQAHHSVIEPDRLQVAGAVEGVKTRDRHFGCVPNVVKNSGLTEELSVSVRELVLSRDCSTPHTLRVQPATWERLAEHPLSNVPGFADVPTARPDMLTHDVSVPGTKEPASLIAHVV